MIKVALSQALVLKKLTSKEELFIIIKSMIKLLSHSKKLVMVEICVLVLI